MRTKHSRGVISQIQEQANVLHGPILLKVLLEEACNFHVHLQNTPDDELHSTSTAHSHFFNCLPLLSVKDYTKMFQSETGRETICKLEKIQPLEMSFTFIKLNDEKMSCDYTSEKVMRKTLSQNSTIYEASGH